MGYSTQIGHGALECAINLFHIKHSISPYSLTCAKPTHKSTTGFSSVLRRGLSSINRYRASQNPTQHYLRQEATQGSSGILYSVNFSNHFRTFWLNLHMMHPSLLFSVIHIRLFLVFLCLRSPALGYERACCACRIQPRQFVKSTKMLPRSSSVYLHASVTRINKLFIIRHLTGKCHIFQFQVWQRQAGKIKVCADQVRDGQLIRALERSWR